MCSLNLTILELPIGVLFMYASSSLPTSNETLVIDIIFVIIMSSILIFISR